MKPRATLLRLEAIDERITRLEGLFSRLNATVLTLIARKKEEDQFPAVSLKEQQGERWDLILKSNNKIEG